jgi:hypothetical protein
LCVAGAVAHVMHCGAFRHGIFCVAKCAVEVGMAQWFGQVCTACLMM